MVEFLMRQGDIDITSSLGSALRAMQEGSRIHRMVQSEGGENYKAEVPLSDSFFFPHGTFHPEELRKPCPQETDDPLDFSIQVEGRADGIVTFPDSILIDEIKGMYYDVAKLEEPVPVHEAQAKCYAYLCLRKKELTSKDQKITVQLTYVSLDSEERQYFHTVWSFSQLEEWFFSLLKEYRKWALYILDHRDRRQASLKDLAFPYAFRPGQRNTAAYVYRTIEQGRKLYLQAPTGSGKTLATVFPTLKAIGLDKADHLYYLTAKTVARKAAEDCFSLLRERGMIFSSVVLTAKAKICPFMEEGSLHETSKCTPELCPYAKGHYDRINDALYDALKTTDAFDRETILSFSEKHQVCPFEFSLDLTDFTDGVICDYNYAFDPNAHLQRFVNGEGIRSSVLLIDEAHNLPDRARNMFSSSMNADAFNKVRRELKHIPGSEETGKQLNAVLRILRKRRKAFEEDGNKQGWRRAEDLDSFCSALKTCYGIMEEFLSTPIEGHEEALTDLRDLYFDIRRFLETADRSEEHYINYEEITEESSYTIRLYCADPSRDLKETLNKVKAAIFFSATLLPVHYYRSLLCADDEKDCTASAQSVFDPSRQKILITNDLTSLYSYRTPDMYRKYAESIQKMCQAEKGNYLVFFPSFSFLEETAQYLDDSSIDFLMQEKGMKEEDKDSFLKRFESASSKRSLCGLAVLGSVFSEGISLEKDSLVGVMVIGTGIGQISTQSNVLKTFFDEKGSDGFSYACIFPGMSKVLQAAGRLIRTEEDKGVLILADRRFTQQRYQSMFPSQWQNIRICTSDSIPEEMQDFWKQYS